MKIGQNEIDVGELPRKLVGGLKPEAVEELLRRIEWDYAQLLFEHRKLEEAADGTRSAPPAPKATQPVSTRAPGELDEFARLALASARRAAGELRESARLDCEAMLKKTHARMYDLELEVERARAAANAELDELNAIIRDIRTEMRSALRSLLPPAAVPGELVPEPAALVADPAASIDSPLRLASHSG